VAQTLLFAASTLVSTLFLQPRPGITLEFTLDRANVKRVPATKLNAPDSQGRIPYLANAPTTVRFIVTQGTEKAEENFAINLEP